jgi:hypothetical protein
VALAGAAISALFIESAPKADPVERLEIEPVALEEAA